MPPSLVAQTTSEVKLKAPDGRTSPVGLAGVFQTGHGYWLLAAARGLKPAGAHKRYGVWLLSSGDRARFVRAVSYPPTRTFHRFLAVGNLPRHLGRYRKLAIALDTGRHPSGPGRIVLEGRWPVRLFKG